ncbi:hypothetical protein [Psychrilyobacter sp.]|uniref:hypothetical protein n=1 Tax=Psychrilyobacter sp. TaxID=2586924 RepID=UPI00301A240A
MIKFGVDNFYLYNFSLGETILEKNEKKDKTTYELSYKDKELGVFLKYIRTEISGVKEHKVSTSLSLNPNKILHGNNIKNANAGEILLAIKKLKLILEKEKIYLDLEGAKVRTAAFNINLNISFESFQDTIFLLMYQETKEVKFNGDIIKSPYYNPNEKINMISHMKHKTKRYFYNKSFLEELDYDLTRYELEPSFPLFRRRMSNLLSKEKKLDSVGLSEFLSNFDEISKNIILYDLKKYISKSQNFLDGKHKKLICRELRQFKLNSKRNKQRNVYEYLVNRFRVYDREFLKVAYYEYDKAHYKREERKIEARYSNLDTKNQIGYLINTLRV